MKVNAVGWGVNRTMRGISYYTLTELWGLQVITREEYDRVKAGVRHMGAHEIKKLLASRVSPCPFEPNNPESASW